MATVQLHTQQAMAGGRLSLTVALKVFWIHILNRSHAIHFVAVSTAANLFFLFRGTFFQST